MSLFGALQCHCLKCYSVTVSNAMMSLFEALQRHCFECYDVTVSPILSYKELHQIKNFRNRIAHHEPICFDMYGSISMEYAQTNYNLTLKYISFLGYDFDELFWGLDVIPDNLMNRILQQ